MRNVQRRLDVLERLPQFQPPPSPLDQIGRLAPKQLSNEELALMIHICSRRYPGGTAYRSIFRTVSRASPNCRAASRSLILSTTTARRTCAYSSTVYTSQVFHKT